MLDAMLARDFQRSIGAAIVDDQSLDLIDPGKLAGQLAESEAEGRFLIKTGNLNDQFHLAYDGCGLISIGFLLSGCVRRCPENELLELLYEGIFDKPCHPERMPVRSASRTDSSGGELGPRELTIGACGTQS